MTGEDYCEKSDLPTSQCGLPCCTPPAPKAAPTVRSGFRRAGDAPVITATSYSTCDECGERIRPDDRIAKPSGYDNWIHEECT